MPNRADLQTLAMRRMERLMGQQRRQVEDVAGFPPDPTNIARLETQFREDYEEHLRALLLLLYIGMADATRIKSDKGKINEQAALFAQLRSAGIAGTMAKNTINRSTKALAELQQKINLTKQDVTQRLSKILGPSRASTVVTTETTRAQSEAREEVFNQKAERDGRVVVIIWQLRPCRHCTFCPLMHNMPKDFWARWVQGPPAHPNCCCELVPRYFDSKKEADQWTQDRLAIAPAHSRVEQAIRESGVTHSGPF